MTPEPIFFGIRRLIFLGFLSHYYVGFFFLYMKEYGIGKILIQTLDLGCTPGWFGLEDWG